MFSSPLWSSVRVLPSPQTSFVSNDTSRGRPSQPIPFSLPFCHLTGASGTGRTTFVNTLCESEVLQHKICDSPETAHLEEGIRIKPVNVGSSCSALSHICHTELAIELDEDGVRIALTIVDTPGFGDNIDNEFAYVLSFNWQS